MALKPDDPCGGFQHGTVVAFINDKMAKHVKGPEFYLKNISLSWGEVENKLKAILEDKEMPSQAKEACTWGGLALGVRCARRQRQLQGCRVRWLNDYARLHRSAAQALASSLQELRAQQETERKASAFRLQMAQASLAEVEKERDLLRWKLLQAELRYHEQVKARGAGTDGAGEEEEAAMAAAAGTAEGGGGEQRGAKAEAAPTEAAQDLAGGFLQPLGAGGRSQVSGNSHVFFLWDPGAPGQQLTGAPSCPAPCLILIFIRKPSVLLLSWTHSVPTNRKGHTTSTSASDASAVGGL
uniref:Testis expressed 13B n=1 Tax=Propithecus coquereli TaxID=379532 RepID=A0A2K6FBC8_PROCO